MHTFHNFNVVLGEGYSPAARRQQAIFHVCVTAFSKLIAFLVFTFLFFFFFFCSSFYSSFPALPEKALISHAVHAFFFPRRSLSLLFLTSNNTHLLELCITCLFVQYLLATQSVHTANGLLVSPAACFGGCQKNCFLRRLCTYDCNRFIV